MMISTSQGADYVHDAIGRRVKRSDGTTNVVDVSWGNDLLSEYTSGQPATSSLRNYVYGDRIDNVLVMLSPTNTLYYHTDAQTSIRCLTDSGALDVETYLYDSYGSPTIIDPNAIHPFIPGVPYNTGPVTFTKSNYGNRFLYTAREWDDKIDQYYFRARWFSPNLARFTSRDPLHYIDGASLYRGYFVPGSVDPSGLITEFEATQIFTYFLSKVKDPPGGLAAGNVERADCHFQVLKDLQGAQISNSLQDLGVDIMTIGIKNKYKNALNALKLINDLLKEDPSSAIELIIKKVSDKTGVPEETLKELINKAEGALKGDCRDISTNYDYTTNIVSKTTCNVQVCQNVVKNKSVWLKTVFEVSVVGICHYLCKPKPGHTCYCPDTTFPIIGVGNKAVTYTNTSIDLETTTP